MTTWTLDPASNRYYGQDPTTGLVVWAPEAPAAAAAPVIAPRMEVALPEIFMQDQAVAVQQIEESRAASAKGRGSFHKFPTGIPDVNWKNAPAGTMVEELIQLMPAAVAGESHYQESMQHSFTIAGRFPKLTCAEREGHTCWLCESRTLLFQSGNQAHADLADKQGRRGKKALYQILRLEHWESHNDKGVFRPFVIEANNSLHKKLTKMVEVFTLPRLIHPTYGRPIQITRSKPKPEVLSIEWDATALDPQALTEHWFAAYHNLYDLKRFVKYPSLQEQFETLQQVGFLIPPGLTQALQLEAQQAQMAAANPAAVPPVPGAHVAPPVSPYGAVAPAPAAPGTLAHLHNRMV